MDYKLMRNKRRAISSVVGLFFFIVVMVGAFTAFILMMETNTEFLNTQLDISQQELAKLQEDFVIFAETQPYRDDSGVILEGHNQFNITVDVENKGKTPVEVVNLWIINKTLPDGRSCELEDDPTAGSEPCEANLVEINYADSFVPVRSTVNILENIPVTMQRGNYDLKVVTSLGNVKVLPIRVGGPPLLLKLVANPPDVANLSNATLTYIVTNNSTKTLYEIKPFQNLLTGEFATVDPSTALQGQNAWRQSGQKVIPKLDAGESGVLSVNYRLTGAKGSAVLFTTNVTAKKAPDSPAPSIFSNNDTARVTMQEEAAGAFGALRQKPEIFVVFPGPAGSSKNAGTDRGFFGVLVVNPTNQTMTISRVTLFAVQGGSGTQRIIEGGETAFDHLSPIGKLPCSGSEPSSTIPEDIVHNGEIGINQPYESGSDGIDDPIGRYVIPENNLVVWTNDDPCNEVIVQPSSSKGFVLRLATNAANELPAFVLGANVHSSAGQFANVGHTSSARISEGATTFINVYPTSDDFTGGSEYTVYPDDYDFVPSGTIDALETDNVFNVTIREGHTDTTNYLPGGGTNPPRLILKLPPGFPAFDTTCCLPSPPNPPNTPFCQYGFDSSAILSREFRDGSIQVEVPLRENLGDISNGQVISSNTGFANCQAGITASCTGGCDSERFTFQFSVDGPDVDKDEVYIYYAFADGRDSENNPIGPVSEAIILRVNGKEGACFGKSPGTVVNAIDEFTGDVVIDPETGLPFEITCE